MDKYRTPAVGNTTHSSAVIQAEKMDDASFIRTNSTVFKCFPWMSGAFTSRPDLRTLASSDHCMWPFLNQLRQFEQNCILQPSHNEGKHYRHLLKIGFTEGPAPILEATQGGHGAAKDWSLLASVVCAYRLADIVALLETELKASPPRIKRTLKGGPKSFLKHYALLGNWTQLLHNFKFAVRNAKPTALPTRTTQSRIDLLKSVACFAASGDINNICANLFAAASHLAYLMKHPFNADELPELTSQLSELTRMDSSRSPDQTPNTFLTEAEAAFWAETLGHDETGSTSKGSSGRERQPLHLALAISPLYLFVPHQLMKNIIGRQNVLCTSVALGNQRPEVLVSVEKVIWRFLLQLADGSIAVEDALNTICNTIPWAELATCIGEDTAWFKLESSQAAFPKPSAKQTRKIKSVTTLETAQSNRPATLQSSRHLPDLPSPSQTISPLPFDEVAHEDSDVAFESEIASYLTQYIEEPSPRTDNQFLPSAADVSELSPLCTSSALKSTASEGTHAHIISCPQLEKKKAIPPLPHITAAEAVSQDVVANQMDLDNDDEGKDDSGKSQAQDENREKEAVTNEHQESSAGALCSSGLLSRPVTRLRIEGAPVVSYNSNAQRKQKSKPKGTAAQKAVITGMKRRVPGVFDEYVDALDTHKDKRQALLSVLSTDFAGKKTHDDFIDIAEYCLLPNFKKSAPPNFINLIPVSPTPLKRHTLDHPITVWDADGRPVEINPRLHNLHELVKLGKTMQQVSQTHINGKARHTASPETSIFRTIHYAEYQKLNPLEISEILRRQCIVVTHMDWKKILFDEEGLDKTVGVIDYMVPIQDLSLNPPTQNFTDRLRQGTPRQMLVSSHAGDCGKALEILSPLDTIDNKNNEYASCRTAWRNTSRIPNMPTNDIYWGLASTAGATSFWHIVGDGLGTTVDIRRGSKLWIASTCDFEELSKIGLFLTPTLIPESFGIEAILLTENTRLIMRPNIIHSVYTPDNTICHGAHFYNTATMQFTLTSLVHGFICDGYITNISHPKTRVLLRQIMLFYHRTFIQGRYISKLDLGHLPQIDVPVGEHLSIDHALDFLSTCAIAFFSNVLDPRTYTPPGRNVGHVPTRTQTRVMETFRVNTITPEERQEICKTRGVALDAISWFRHCFTSSTDQGQPTDIISQYFAQIARSVLRYKYAAQVKGVSSTAVFDARSLEQQIENVLKLDTMTWSLWLSEHQNRWLDDEIQDHAGAGITDVPSCLHNLQQPSDAPEHHPLWREEKIDLPNRASYCVVRCSTNDGWHSIGEDQWANAGRTDHDKIYLESMRWRELQESLGVRDLLARLDSQSTPQHL